MSGGHLFQPGGNTFSSFCFVLFFFFSFSFLSFNQVATSSKSSPYFIVVVVASWQVDFSVIFVFSSFISTFPHLSLLLLARW